MNDPHEKGWEGLGQRLADHQPAGKPDAHFEALKALQAAEASAATGGAASLGKGLLGYLLGGGALIVAVAIAVTQFTGAPPPTPKDRAQATESAQLNEAEDLTDRATPAKLPSQVDDRDEVATSNNASAPTKRIGQQNANLAAVNEASLKPSKKTTTAGQPSTPNKKEKRSGQPLRDGDVVAEGLPQESLSGNALAPVTTTGETTDKTADSSADKNGTIANATPNTTTGIDIDTGYSYSTSPEKLKDSGRTDEGPEEGVIVVADVFETKKVNAVNPASTPNQVLSERSSAEVAGISFLPSLPFEVLLPQTRKIEIEDLKGAIVVAPASIDAVGNTTDFQETKKSFLALGIGQQFNNTSGDAFISAATTHAYLELGRHFTRRSGAALRLGFSNYGRPGIGSEPVNLSITSKEFINPLGNEVVFVQRDELALAVALDLGISGFYDLTPKWRLSYGLRVSRFFGVVDRLDSSPDGFNLFEDSSVSGFSRWDLGQNLGIEYRIWQSWAVEGIITHGLLDLTEPTEVNRDVFRSTAIKIAIKKRF